MLPPATPLVFFVLSLERRQSLHVNVTAHPHAAWAAQQMVEAVGFDAMLSRVIRDRNGIYGKVFDARVKRLGLEQLRIAPRSPWQNGYAERFVGTLRRELLDHVVVLGERHLLRLVRQHARYYNEDRPHMSLAGDAPAARAVEPIGSGRVIALPRIAVLLAFTIAIREPRDRFLATTGRQRSPAGLHRNRLAATGKRWRQLSCLHTVSFVSIRATARQIR